MISLCKNCKPHPFQDKEYGKNMRVFNPMRKSNSRAIVGYRCTVCLITIAAPKSDTIDSKKGKKDE